MSCGDLLRWRRGNIILSMVGSIVVLMLLFRNVNDDYSSYSSFGRYESRAQNITLDLSHLQALKISSTFTYARRSITIKNVEGERSTLTTVNKTLFPNLQQFDLSNLTAQRVTELPALALQVPASPKADTSIMSFGIATKIPRLNDSTSQLSHWLSNTSSLLTVVVPPHDDTLDLVSTMKKAPISININVTTSTLPFVKAYFSLVKELYDYRTPSTQWLVLIDDDTFIPSLPYLISHLTTTYDASRPQLVAAISDDFDQIRSWGLIPLAAAGSSLMSIPLAALLVAPGVYDKCLASSRNQGDGIFSDCVNTYTDVKPIFDHGLNQMDIRWSPEAGDGYFESGRRMLTVHHWKSWYHADMPLAAKVSKVAGDEGIFMRWLFEGGVVLSNGYSIVEYGKGIVDVDLSKVERTWDGTDGRWLHFVGPLREKMGGDKKKSYRLVDAEMIEGGLRQVYVHKASEGDVGIDVVLELLWLK